MDANSKIERKRNPRENAFPLSAATFWYTIPTFINGFKHDLETTDLTETLTEHKSNRLGDKIEKVWHEEEIRAKRKQRTPSLRRALARVFGFELLFYGLIYLISESVRMFQPIFLGRLLAYYVPGQVDITIDQAYLFALGVVLCSVINISIQHPYMMGVLHLGMKMRVACCSLIYRKSLKLSKTALGDTTCGQIVNLLSNDVNRFDIGLLFLHMLWIGPLETIICTYFIYLQVDISAVIGVVFLLIFIPLQIYLGKRISVLRLRTALRTDERVRLMNEIITGIQVIKMYAWEKPFAQLVDLSRRYEIKSIRGSSYMRGITYSFIMFTTRLSVYASVLSYVLMDNAITAEKVFVVTSFYNILRQTMAVYFPQGITQVAETVVSVDRLNKFMLYEEIDLDNKSNNDTIYNDEEKKQTGVYLDNFTAKWNLNSTQENTLSSISLSATPGKLLAIIGPVGSGKTSLLHAILMELPPIEGKLETNGVLSYASQEPWLFSGTVRQNILFGLPMDKLRYKTVIKKCSLQRDFELLPYGDKTIVGDRGVSLSGGQRARINLARCVYKQADIYLLDDPLSAVDTHVGHEIFNNCIAGYLKNKTVILITHQLQFIQYCDHIIYLDNGHIRAEGNYQQLINMDLDFTNLFNKQDGEEAEKNEKDDELSRQGSIRSIISIDDKDAPKIIEEQKSKGSVGFHIYLNYFKAGGNCCVIFTMFLLFILTQIAASLSDYFVTFWTNIEQEDAASQLESILLNDNETTIILHDRLYKSNDFWHFSRNTCIITYSVIIGALIVLTLIRSFTFFTVCMRASINLHNNMFKSIINGTMRFFNTNPIGRILNRFSKDIGAIDELLTVAMIDCLQIGLALLGIIVVIAIVNPLLMIPTCVAAVFFYFLRIVYVRTSRNVKRLEGVTRSPVFSHLNASLQGLTTIRAFNAQQILRKEFDRHQDLHSSAWFSFLSTSRAFGYWLDIICSLYIVVVTFSFLLIGNEKFGGNVGLAITQAIGLTGMFQWGMRQTTELENQMTSVERVLEYNSIEHEKSLETLAPQKKPAAIWPEFGKIIFRDVYLRYFPNEPPVLKNLNFVINSGEKIGIVGRTGAGKSSLISALFQLTDTEGLIEVDEIDITKIGLHDLRKKISIIPQEPVLFSGTMRKNLDPFSEYTDDQLWGVLEDVELKETIEDFVAGLDTRMSEGGTNFSVGQRQLVCLARAILRNNKILVLDEATANIDPKTDNLIQTTIRKKFKDCTVLTIAHRLNTIMDSDRILVMDAGCCIEYDHAYRLLQNTDSVFYGMVMQTGKPLSEILYNVAKANWHTQHSHSE